VATLEYVEAWEDPVESTREVVAPRVRRRYHNVIEALQGIQHELQDVISNPSQTHEGEWCLESLCCRGPAERVREPTDRLRDFDWVRRVNVVVLPEGAD